MKCFNIDLNVILKIILLGKETLIPPRLHYCRYITEYVLYVVVKGNLNLNVNSRTIHLVAGDIYLFKRGDYQEPLESSFCEYYYIHFLSDQISETELEMLEYVNLHNQKLHQCMQTDSFSPKCYDYLNILIRQSNHISSADTLDNITNILQNNIMTTEYKTPEKRFYLSTAVASILLKLEYLDVNPSNTVEQSLEKQIDIARKISSYIEHHYTEPISSEDIEHEFLLTFDYANRVFKKVMGCTIIKYRNAVRIQYAKAKMRATNMAIKEIALDIGFENIYYFSRTFKMVEGLSPSEYKRKFIRIQDDSNQIKGDRFHEKRGI